MSWQQMAALQMLGLGDSGTWGKGKGKGQAVGGWKGDGKGQGRAKGKAAAASGGAERELCGCCGQGGHYRAW